MGYSSYLCKRCNLPIASEDCTGVDEPLHWLQACVLLTAHATVAGRYNGFGHIIDPDRGIDVDVYDCAQGAPVILHQDCWTALKQPKFDTFDSPSPSDPNQGHPPKVVWNQKSPLDPDRFQWKFLKRFGARKYFVDENTGRISQVGDSGSVPHQSEDGVLWLDDTRSIVWHRFGKIPVVEENTGRVVWLGADTKEECEWVASKLNISIQSGSGDPEWIWDGDYLTPDNLRTTIRIDDDEIEIIVEDSDVGITTRTVDVCIPVEAMLELLRKAKKIK